MLTDYFDIKGIHHVLFAKNHPLLKPITTFKSFEAAREFMSSFIRKFDLCQKYCGINTGPGVCFDYQIKKCKGVCANMEDIETYNQRVETALKSLNCTLDTKMIIDEGRTFNEKSVVLIENGVYKGFGYFDSNIKLHDTEEAKNFIQPYKHNTDVQRILSGFC